MKSLSRLFILCLLCGMATRLVSAQVPNALDNSQSQDPLTEAKVERMLTITYDQRQAAANELTELFTTSRIVRRAARPIWPDKQIEYFLADHFKGSRSRDPGRLTISTLFKSNLQTVTEGNAGVITGTLTVLVSPDPGPEKLAQAIDAINQQVLNVLHSRENILHEQAEVARSTRRNEADRVADELQKLRSEQRKFILQGQSQPKSVLLEGIQQLQKERQSLELDSVSTKVRIEALEKQIAVENEKAKEVAEKNEAIENLEKLVAEHEKRLELLFEYNRKVPGTSPKDTISRAQEELLKAKVDLARSKAEVRKPAEARIAQLVDQLTQNSIDMTVSEARLKYVKVFLEKYTAELNEQEDIAIQAQRLDVEIARLVGAQQELTSGVETRPAPRVSASIRVEDDDEAAADKSKSE